MLRYQKAKKCKRQGEKLNNMSEKKMRNEMEPAPNL